MLDLVASEFSFGDGQVVELLAFVDLVPIESHLPVATGYSLQGPEGVACLPYSL